MNYLNKDVTKNLTVLKTDKLSFLVMTGTQTTKTTCICMYNFKKNIQIHSHIYFHEWQLYYYTTQKRATENSVAIFNTFKI